MWDWCLAACGDVPSVRAISDQTGFIEELLTIRSLVAARTEGSRATSSVPRSSVVAAYLPHGPQDIPRPTSTGSNAVQSSIRLLR